MKHLTYSSNTVGLKKVVAPSVGWSHAVRTFWVSGDRRRNESIRSSSVFVKDHVSAKCTDTEEAGRGEVRAKIDEVIAHPLMCLLALGVEAPGRWRVDLDKEHRMLVARHGERRIIVVRTMGTLVRPPDDVKRASETKKLVQERIVA